MTQEEKQLLLQDLSARLPYRVQVEIQGFYSGVLRGIDNGTVSTDRGINYPLRYVKPYLRPMSSMTEEEDKEFALLQTNFYVDGFLYPIAAINMVNWLNVHHFDFRGLIPKGLAIEAPKNMYKIKT